MGSEEGGHGTYMCRCTCVPQHRRLFTHEYDTYVCMCFLSKRVLVVLSLLLRLTSLLTELLGQSILEKDLSSVRCRGSEREREEGETER